MGENDLRRNLKRRIRGWSAIGQQFARDFGDFGLRFLISGAEPGCWSTSAITMSPTKPRLPRSRKLTERGIGRARPIFSSLPPRRHKTKLLEYGRKYREAKRAQLLPPPNLQARGQKLRSLCTFPEKTDTRVFVFSSWFLVGL